MNTFIWIIGLSIFLYVADNFIKKSGLGNRRNKEIDPYKKLLNSCFGNKERAESLIRYEMTKDNAKNKNDAINSAIDRLERDRR